MPRRGRSRLSDERIFFVTTTVIKFQKVFEASLFCQILIDNIKYYQRKFKFVILAYVIMPNHFHWVVITNPKYGTISDIMRDIKKYTAWQVFDLLEMKKMNWLLHVFEKAAVNKMDQRRKLWMERFDDFVIRSDFSLWTIVDYIHENPVKKGLVKAAVDYKYSSARNYFYNDQSVIEVDTGYLNNHVLQVK
jgi:REP element-mobilizing transposase RayT